MNKSKILGLTKVGDFLKSFLATSPENYTEREEEFALLLKRSEVENPWFDPASLRFCIESWASLLNETSLEDWLSPYKFNNNGKRVGLILAGNIPMVGWHDVMSVILSNNIPVIKLSSKDRWMIPFLLKIWNDNTEGGIVYETTERLVHFDAVIATGSNNTARYLDYYFKKYKSIIRKNRTSVAILKGDETVDQLQALADDIFTYYGLGCRNVTKLLLPEGMKLDSIFENFVRYKEVINHNKYANNYDYNRAIFLLNKDLFWDNNFVMLKEDVSLFGPLSVVNFSRYKTAEDIQLFLENNKNDIQAVVANPELKIENSVSFGEAQKPSLSTYADNVDTLQFLADL